MKLQVIIGICLSLPLWLTGCGGGGGGGDTSVAGSVSPAGVSSGTITGFGSVFVNGIKFNTDNATVFRGDDQLNSVRDLSVGMMVRVEGDLDNSIARTVQFDEDVKGPADGPATGNSFSVMGQTVITDASTIFNNTSLGAITGGDILEISGMRNSNDEIVARFVERKTNPANVNRYSLIGNVRSLDTNVKTFLVDNLSVNYSLADVNDLAGGDPVEGQLVEVKDDNKSYTPGSLALSATKIEPQNRLGTGGTAGSKVEIESLVTRVNSASEFEIGGIVVKTSNATLFLFGASSDIVVGARLEVEGIVSSGNILQASKVKFEDNDARIEANVDPLGVNTGSGTVTLLGTPVTVTSGTRMDDKRDNVVPFNLGDIADNDYLEVRGFRGANGAFVATELTRDNDDSRVEIRSPVTAVDAVAGTVDILGITVNTNGSTEFRDRADRLISASQFFGAIIEQLTIVKAKWDPFTDVSAPVKELELED